MLVPLRIALGQSPLPPKFRLTCSSYLMKNPVVLKQGPFVISNESCRRTVGRLTRTTDAHDIGSYMCVCVCVYLYMCILDR